MKNAAIVTIGLTVLTVILAWPFGLITYIIAAIHSPENAPIIAQWALIPATLYWFIAAGRVSAALAATQNKENQ